MEKSVSNKSAQSTVKSAQSAINKWALPVLTQLADGKFHSGEALASHFGVTRATIFNAIHELEGLGLRVFAVTGKGYRLPQPIQLLNQAEILQAMGEHQGRFHLQVLDAVDSTNRYLMQASAKGVAHATCAVAHIQTQGRGRRGRSWVSQLGASLTFSVLWRFNVGAAALAGLSLAVGLALLRAMHQLGANQVRLKWPNDLVVVAEDGHLQKLAGILIELQGDMEGPSAAVIGVGINLNLPHDLQKQIDQSVTDVSRLCGQPANPNQVLAEVLVQLSQVLATFETGGFAELKHAWSAMHALHLAPVNVLMPDASQIAGRVVDVTDDGNLLLETAQGVQRFSAGEISLRRAV